MKKTRKRKIEKCLLVEPINKSPYPPLGLMRISTMLKSQRSKKQVIEHFGPDDPPLGIGRPDKIYITSLFTWEIPEVVKKVNRLRYLYPDAEIIIGGISASLLPDIYKKETGIKPHVGVYSEAERFAPDYTMTFGRKLNTSITLTTRGCNNGCKFCCVPILEGKLRRRYKWTDDINPDFKRITLWDNNILDVPNFGAIIQKLKKFNKIIDFNQGMDARLYKKKSAEVLHEINLDPIRFAYDSKGQEKHVIRAIRLAKTLSDKEIRVYALYNFKESPEEYYERINTLNKEGALVYPMKYRSNTEIRITPPNNKWDARLLRAFGLSLRFYYRRGLITENRKAFLDIYGRTPKQFKKKLYDIFDYDKNLKR